LFGLFLLRSLSITKYKQRISNLSFIQKPVFYI